MKFSALIAFLLLASSAYAGPREWKPATVVAITSGTAGAAVVPVGTAMVGGYIGKNFYYLQTDTTIYVVSCIPGTMSFKCPDVTLHGMTKIAVDGQKAHVLGDDGKDRKMPIVEKIAVKP
jgi:hypothetical protein